MFKEMLRVILYTLNIIIWVALIYSGINLMLHIPQQPVVHPQAADFFLLVFCLGAVVGNVWLAYDYWENTL